MTRKDLEALKNLRERIRALACEAYEKLKETSEEGVDKRASYYAGQVDGYNHALITLCDTMNTMSKPRRTK